MTIFYYYLIASHPNIVLSFYLCLYGVSAKYVFDIGGLLDVVDKYDDDNVGIVRTKPSLIPTEDEEENKENKHTKRGLKCRCQEWFTYDT